MGNQTLIPSQIQSVESYLLDLKNYVQFRSSLGSTTFMKTAKVNLIENIYDDLTETRAYLTDATSIPNNGPSNANLNINSSSSPFSIASGGHLDAESIQNEISAATATVPGSSLLSNPAASVSATSTLKLTYQQQYMRQRLQLLYDQQQQVVVKVFPKYDLSIRLDLYIKRVREIKNTIYSRYDLCTNCLPFSDLIINDRAAYLFRQYIKFNLYDRISTRPFLTLIEKKWIAFQLLCAVNEIHSLQIVHGDIKMENVLVNSFLWVSLTDFASYKPAYLSKNHPSADFNYYFDISRRRTCCLAPERFDSSRIASEQSNYAKQQQSAATNVTNLLDQENIYEHKPPDPNDFDPSMDIFSVGCVLAELFMERPLFDFARLLAYRERKLDPSGELANEIEDKNILNMIMSMISLNTKDRRTANQYLQEQNDKAFPSYFVFLKNYMSRFINVHFLPDKIVMRLKNDLLLLLKNFKLNLNNENQTEPDANESNEKQLNASAANQAPETKLTKTQSNTSNNDQTSLSLSLAFQQSTNDAFLILLPLLLSSVRKLKYIENKLIAIELMSFFSKYLDDSLVLDRVLPYYLSMLDEQNQPSIVKSRLIFALNDCLSNIYNLDLQNLNIFPEIIFNMLEKLTKDESFLVRSSVAKTISNFALTSLRYLDTSLDTSFLNKKIYQLSKNKLNKLTTVIVQQTTKMNQQQSGIDVNSINNFEAPLAGALDSDDIAARYKTKEFDKEKYANYDKEYEFYQSRVTEIVMHLITDIDQLSNSSNAVKETLIRSDIGKLCSFFSRQKTCEFLLPHMITILNEKTDWSVRAAFFDALCTVLGFIGWESVEIVKSLLEQGLRDSEEFVIQRTLIALSKMAEIGLLDKQQICFFLGNHIASLLCHPSLWIRHGAVNFVVTVCKQSSIGLSNSVVDSNDNRLLGEAALRPSMTVLNCLNMADILCSVTPLLSKYLSSRASLIIYDREELLFSCLKSPIKRAVYDCIAQDGRSDKLFFYLNQRSEIRKLTRENYLPGYVDCTDANVQQFFEKLCKLGFIEEDEDKLLQMREFIDKTRISRLSSSLHNADLMNSSDTSANGVVLNSLMSQNINNALQIKENYMLKEGFITIMKDKFQRCNCEYLNIRIEQYTTNSASFDNQKLANDSFGTTPTGGITSASESTIRREPSFKGNPTPSTSTTSRSDDGQPSATTEENLNAEWRMMFSRATLSPTQSDSNEAISSINHLPKATQRQKTRNASIDLHTKPRSAQQQHSSTGVLFNRPQQTGDCLINVEKYLDRCLLIYEEHKLKHTRSVKHKETVNNCLSSNNVSLNSSIGKWKPKGLLVLHSNEHTKEISKLCRNRDSTYFASCSASESCVKIWSTDNILDGKSGFYKSIFTYDKQTNVSQRNNSSALTTGGNSDATCLSRPISITFCDRNSLAILAEDFKFNIIDFSSHKSVFKIFFHDRLFKTNICRHSSTSSSPLSLTKSPLSSFDKATYYYLNKSFRNTIKKCVQKTCLCTTNMPVEMIYIDETCPSWPFAATNIYEYYKSSNVKGLFCYSSTSGEMTCIDIRTRTKAFDVRRNLNHGYITSMITDPWYTWLSVGTSTGSIEIYDFRFMLPLQKFEHRSKTSVVKMCNHPMASNKIIASYQANNEIAVWNLSNSGSPKLPSNVKKAPTVFGSTTVVEPELVFWGVQSVPPLCQNKMTKFYISGMIGCSSGDVNGSNGLVCASTDMKIRYIDLNEPHKDSYQISSAFNVHHNSASACKSTSSSSNSSSTTQTYEFANSLMNQSVTFETRQIEGTKVLLELDQYNSTHQYSLNNNSSMYNSAALTHQTYFTHHQDAISDLILCYNPVNNKNQPLMLTSSRDGSLKVWR
jgi:serine/threonine protein kinase